MSFWIPSPYESEAYPSTKWLSWEIWSPIVSDPLLLAEKGEQIEMEKKEENFSKFANHIMLIS